MLDGASRLDDLFAEASHQGMTAIAMTDHGNLFGAYDFWKKGRAAGVKPIIGLEGYYAPQGRSERKPFDFGGGFDEGTPEDPGAGRGKHSYTHMTLWAENTAGMHNLFRLSSLASLEGQYHKPRFDRELLERYSTGLIGTTGCASGEVNRWLQAGQYDKARAAAADFRDIFGQGNFFAEVMDHGLAIERNFMPDLIKIAKDLKLPLVATNDMHYVHAHDAETHDVLLCIGTRTTMDDPKRFRFDARDFYLKSAAEMRSLWSDYPEACDNTLLIAERCNVEFTEGANLMPRADIPAGENEDSWLVKEVEIGLSKRYPHGVPDNVRQQAHYELGVIAQMGFPGYFLVVADLVRHAKENGIRVGPGRGSAAGAMIAYALGITDLDPIAHGLLFERFLNPERISMPDIDIDFDERRRGDMIRYATEKYGEERVAQIVTYGSIKAKAAVKDSARVLGMPYAVGDRITKAMPPAVMGKDITLAGAFNPKDSRYSEAAEFRALYDSDPEVRTVVDTAKGLEGLKRQPGVHAAGVILCREPLMDVIPVWKREQDGAIITQFDMGACEALGLLKMDFLGLRNLTVLDDCLINIERNTGERIVLEELSLDDRAAYDLLARGDTLGVFQLDGGPMRSLLRSMQPDNFEDISAVLALYRPGPMGANAHNDYADRKNGRKPVVPIHPELEEPLSEILGDTYGLIVYQEQVMAIAQQLAGYSLGKADLLRRAMGKKKKSILEKEFVPFSDGMKEKGFSEPAINKLWEVLVPFSDYAFNKAHTAGYGLVSYWTAYLKANYPAEYMAALLTSMSDDKDRSAIYLNECRRMGIKVLPPDVNDSDAHYTPRGTDIRFGLTAIRNIGYNVVESIVSTRERVGRFTDFHDFIAKVDVAACNRRVVESLIKAGAFDSLGHTRKGLASVHEQVIDTAVEIKRSEAVGQFDLFGGLTDSGDAQLFERPEIGIAEWDKGVLLAHERDMLGLYVSDHPLIGMETALAQISDRSIASVIVDENLDGAVVTLGGLVTAVQRKTTKKGSAWAIITLEDLEGTIELMVFPQSYASFGALLVEDSILVIRARVDRTDDDGLRAVALEISAPDLSAAPSGPVRLSLAASRCVPPLVARLKAVLAEHPGTTEVQLHLTGGTTTTVMKLDDQYRVTPTPSLFGDLKALLGASCLM
ncbi:MAG: DNA polymerase III subunit alpha [Candidatus Nanopelagicales bacterium]|nr:DNA polymerase III subunit alpha [Candidatus Nanopelagicales bacterium]